MSNIEFGCICPPASRNAAIVVNKNRITDAIAFSLTSDELEVHGACVCGGRKVGGWSGVREAGSGGSHAEGAHGEGFCALMRRLYQMSLLATFLRRRRRGCLGDPGV